MKGPSYLSGVILGFAFAASFLMPMLPLLLNGAPFIGDSWDHIKIAEDTVKSGTYKMEEYNERWPLVNLIPASLTILTGIPEYYTSQAVPLLAGLAVVPFYCLCRRLGLSKLKSAFAVFFLNFNPLYSYLTFTGVVMKETATYYLTVAFVLIVLINSTRGPKPRLSWTIASAIMGLGVVLGHHYASLVMLIFLWAHLGYTLTYKLKGQLLSSSMSTCLCMVYTVAFFSWNRDYLALKNSFAPFNIDDLMLLSAIIVIVWCSFLNNRGVLSGRFPWLVCLGFVIAVLGLRGGVHLLVQPIPPMSSSEATNYFVAGAVAIVGLGLGLKSVVLKAYATSAVAMLLFAFLWGFSLFGFALLIKSLHYFGFLVAVGGGFALSVLDGLKMGTKKGVLQKAVAFCLVGFLIQASWTGLQLSLNGLSAYTKGEVESARGLAAVVNLNVYGDTRLAYLLPYLSDLNVSGFGPIGKLGDGFLFVLFRKNWEMGFLIDYDWVTKEEIIDVDLADNLSLIYNTGLLQAWLT